MRDSGSKAVFLDRDGVLIEDRGPLCSAQDIRVLPGVVDALQLLHDSGHALVVVSNQPVVARGLLDEPGVLALHAQIELTLQSAGAPPLGGFYFCPHHPNASRAEYRRDCDCRKPRAGLLQRACAERHLDAGASVMVGDRPSDITAGIRAGCRTVLVQTGRHLDPPIVTTEPFAIPTPDHRCSDLLAAARWIVEAAA